MLLVVEQHGLRLRLVSRVGSGGTSRQVESFCDTELGVKPVWSIGGCDKARSTCCKCISSLILLFISIWF